MQKNFTQVTSLVRERAALLLLSLRDDDKLVGVEITAGKHDILLFSSAGKVNPL